MKKKILSIMLSLALMLTMIPMLGGVAFAGEKPQAPENLQWDGTRAIWEIPNPDNVVHVYANLYNKADTSRAASQLGGDSTTTSWNWASELIPGSTYYFEVYFCDDEYTESDHVISADYTVPGSYTKPNLTNLVLGADGKASWDKAAYAVEYLCTLYVKDGENWSQVLSGTTVDKSWK